MKYIDELKKEDLKGKRVLLRLDLNAPVIGGKITDPYRIDRAVDTIDFLRKNEAQTIIISHCDSEEGGTLVPAWHYLNGLLPVEFSPTYFTPEAMDKILKLKDKDVLLFENVRQNPGEAENDSEFARKLSQMADLYVNDAFAVMHRKHASIVGVPEHLPHYGGLLLKEEIENLQKVFNPEHPFLFIIGGAKFDTKLPLVKKYIEKADNVFIGGALANDFFKAKGFEVGMSLLSDTKFNFKELLKNPKIILPVDVTVIKPDGSQEIKSPDKVKKNEFISDAGTETVKQIKDILKTTKTVVWNGPVGKYERGEKDKSLEISKIIMHATEKLGVFSIIGGGDTVASLNTTHLDHKFSFVSTGGGAMLDYLVHETLPGIEALDK